MTRLVVGLGGVVVLVLAGLVADDGRVEGLELDVFELINDLPDWIEYLVWPFQQLGNIVIALLVGLAVALYLRRPVLAGAVVGAVILKLVLEDVVKQVVERERPGTSIGPEINARGDVSSGGLSFVSGHAVITAAIAGLLTPFLPGRWKLVPWVVVVLNGFGRIYVGAHNPLDVVGGIGLGLFIALVLVELVGAIERRPAASPGPR